MQTTIKYSLSFFLIWCLLIPLSSGSPYCDPSLWECSTWSNNTCGDRVCNHPSECDEFVPQLSATCQFDSPNPSFTIIPSYFLFEAKPNQSIMLPLMISVSGDSDVNITLNPLKNDGRIHLSQWTFITNPYVRNGLSTTFFLPEEIGLYTNSINIQNTNNAIGILALIRPEIQKRISFQIDAELAMTTQVVTINLLINETTNENDWAQLWWVESSGKKENLGTVNLSQGYSSINIHTIDFNRQRKGFVCAKVFHEQRVDVKCTAEITNELTNTAQTYSATNKEQDTPTQKYENNNKLRFILLTIVVVLIICWLLLLKVSRKKFIRKR